MKKKQENIDLVLLLKVIEDRVSAGEKALFQTWYNEAKENANLFEELKRTYHLASFDKRSVNEHWEKVVNKVRTGYSVPDFIELHETNDQGKLIKLSILMRVAAFALLVVGLTFTFKTIVFNHEQFIVSGHDLKNNEPYHLADGSLVYLHDDAGISFKDNFAKKHRELHLKGEAFFEVEKNAQLPFIISSKNTKTKVVGTSFNVFSNTAGEVKV